MEKTLIFGHRNPDTDSVTAAITLSYLKNKLGMSSEPRVLGDLSSETKFVLDYFKVDYPKYLNDTKLQIKDLNYTINFFVNENESLQEAFNLMDTYKISTIPVVNNNEQLQGILSIKSIARKMIAGDFQTINSSYNNILDIIEGTEILKFSDEISGKSLSASYRTDTFINTIELDNDHILIVGDRHNIIEHAVKSGIQLLIISGSGFIKEEHLEIARKNKVSVIKSDMRSLNVAQKLVLSNYVKDIMETENVITTKIEDNVNDFIELVKKHKYTNYPICDSNNKYLGYITSADVNDKKAKKVILVDHNEAEQSVEGLEEAEILEIIDHHKIGSLKTNLPINFRNVPVGSTNTIIYSMYKENNIEITKEMAGLMLSAIISDTLLLKSPTTTIVDKNAIIELSKIAEVDYENYGLEMFKASSSLDGKSLDDILYSDFKNFLINDNKVGVGQILTLDIDSLLNKKGELITLLNHTASNKEYNTIALFVTDIIKNGSYVFYSDNSKKILEDSFNIELNQGTYIDGCVSRKKQIIPNIMHNLEK